MYTKYPWEAFPIDTLHNSNLIHQQHINERTTAGEDIGMACKKAFDKIVIALGGKAGEYKNALAPGEASQDGELRRFGQDVHKTPTQRIR